MPRFVSIVTPAYRAGQTIVRAALSVLAQTHADFEWIMVADDDEDYPLVLGRAGIADERFRFLATGKTGSGASAARNIGLDAARHDIVALLDADDMFHAQKLARAVSCLEQAGIVSTALSVVDSTLRPLREVGVGPDRPLTAGAYKFTNVSMDSMLVYNRKTADPRFNPDFPCLNDIEFALRLFATNPAIFHLGMPLHTYVKEPGSISNQPGASPRMVATKKRLLAALAAGDYEFADPEAAPGLIRFYELSLAAEETFGQSLSDNPGLLFEDHLESILASA